MTEKVKVSADFEWVNARAACSPAKVFEQLRSQVAHDVEIRNKMAEGRGYAFSMHVESTAFAVFVDRSTFYGDSPYRVTRFVLEGETIVARYGNDTDIFSATLTLDDEGKCMLKIKGENYELWQARHMALEKLFFEIFRH